MAPTDFIGMSLTALLLAGFAGALIDLGSRIVKQHKRPFNLLKLSPYPLVPDEPVRHPPRHDRRDGLQLQPVPIEVDHRHASR